MTKDQTSIRRILVALDASPASLSALQNAVELAARLEAELIGLFVEDINLLRAAQLPLAREVSFFSTTLRRLESVDLERQLRAQAQQMRQILARTAGDRGVGWHFRVTRGLVAAEVLAAGAEADLMVLGKIGRSFPGFRQTGSTVRMMITQRAGLTLIWQAGVRLTLPVVVVYDGSQSARKGLQAGGHLIRDRNGRLTVFVVAEDEISVRELQTQVEQRLQERGLAANFRLLIRPGLDVLARMIRVESTGPVVLPCEKEPLEGEQLCNLVDQLANPVLLVR
jgi:nucleotide-binding universal stress UspA family protein